MAASSNHLDLGLLWQSVSTYVDRMERKTPKVGFEHDIHPHAMTTGPRSPIILVLNLQCLKHFEIAPKLQP